MPLPRAVRARLVWALELSLGLELYACAVLALHARGLRATPLEASLALVLPALVIPPVFYLLVGLVSIRPLALAPMIVSVATMCALHAMLVLATGALFMVTDLLGYGGAVAFALWGSPTVTLLQLTAAPLVFARLRPLVFAWLRPLMGASRAPRAGARAVATQRSVPETLSAAPSPAAAGAATLPPMIRPLAPVVNRTAPMARPPVVVRPAGKPAAPAARPTTPPPAPGAVQSVAPPTPVAGQPLLKTWTPPPAPPVVSTAATPSSSAAPVEPKPSAPPSKGAIDWTEPMVRIPFVRIADQLPVEMFARGREGLKDTLRPGVSLLVPRKLLLPHLAEGLAPVKWDVVADQFPLDELALSHKEIAERLPDGSLLLPLDEVVPQIPPELLALSTPPADVRQLEEFPAPFQPQAATAEPVVGPARRAAESAPEIDAQPEDTVARADAADESAKSVAAPEPEVDEEVATEEPDVGETLAVDEDADRSRATQPEPPVLAGAVRVTPSPASAIERDKREHAQRIAALLTPLLNGLEIGQHDGAGTTLVTAVAPTLSEEAVVQTAARIVPFLTDARLPEPVTQATLTAAGATVVLTPFGSPAGGGALLATAIASRASLAWLERVSRMAARESQSETGRGTRSGPEADSNADIELRTTAVPTAVRELAGALTAFGPVAPTLLRDRAGLLSACLFLPSSLDALPLAQFARDLYGALGGAEIGRVASVILKLGARRVILRSMDGESGNVTMLVGVGRIDRPGLARIELDRAATRLAALVGS